MKSRLSLIFIFLLTTKVPIKLTAPIRIFYSFLQVKLINSNLGLHYSKHMSFDEIDQECKKEVQINKDICKPLVTNRWEKLMKVSFS
jgi:hypothetical protein